MGSLLGGNLIRSEGVDGAGIVSYRGQYMYAKEQNLVAIDSLVDTWRFARELSGQT